MNLPRRLVTVAVVAPLILFFAWMIRGMLAAMTLAGLFAVVLFPVARWFRTRLRNRNSLAASVVVLLMLALVVAPFSFIIAMATRSFAGLAAKFSQIPKSEWAVYVDKGFVLVDGLIGRTGFEISHDDIIENLTSAGQTVLTFLGGWFGGLAASAPNVMLSSFVFLLALFFLLRDGEAVQQRIATLLPFDAADTKELFVSVRDTITGVMLGSLLVGFIQSSLVLVLLLILGVPAAFLLFVIALLLSFVPIIGTTPISGGAVIYLLVTGRTGAAIAMLVGMVVVGLVDNIARPIIQARSGNMHPLLSLISIFGGMQSFGAIGVFLGPVIAAFALWGVDMYARVRHAMGEATGHSAKVAPPSNG